MSLFAYDDDLIHASEAENGKIYYCVECFLPVKVRRGKHRFPHFYHLRTSPRCRLYSKTEDHLLAQIQLEKSFPDGAIQLERSFLPINRVADLCWEKEKIIFEVQCSPMTPFEAEHRIKDYRSLGYEIVWLLDDKRYNKRILRPTEELLRTHCCYYVSIRQDKIYDQMEILHSGLRAKKGNKFQVDVRRPSLPPKLTDPIPKQIENLIPNCPHHFPGDRLSRAASAAFNPNMAATLEYWRLLEIQYEKNGKKPSAIAEWSNRNVVVPYDQLFQQFLLDIS
jgi:competence protein CoiA